MWVVSEVVYHIIVSIPIGATLWSMCVFATFSGRRCASPVVRLPLLTTSLGGGARGGIRARSEEVGSNKARKSLARIWALTTAVLALRNRASKRKPYFAVPSICEHGKAGYM